MTPGQDTLARVMDRLDELPPMPHTVAEVMEMSQTDDYAVGDLADVVCKDPTLAARVLKLCNSGFYGLQQEITSLQRAVVLLGFEMTKNLVLSSFVYSVMQGDFDAYAQTAQSLWEHSFGAATACLALAERAAPELAESAYTAGLLHDIGKVALAALVSERFEEILALVRARKASFPEAERAVLGIDHAEVGALVAERWKLAPALREVIRHHHDHEETSQPRLAALVRLADGICGILGVGPGLDAADAQLDGRSLEVLGLQADRLEPVLDEVMRRVLDVRDFEMF